MPGLKSKALADGEVDSANVTTTLDDIVPTITGGGQSTASANGFTVTTNKPYGSNSFLISGAFDDTSTIYASQEGGGAVTVTISADMAYLIDAYAVTVGNSVKQYGAVVLQASSDNATWVELDSQTLSNTRTAGRELFSLPSSDDAYRYYRLTFSSLEGVNIDIAEIELLSSNTTVVSISDPAIYDAITIAEFDALGIKKSGASLSAQEAKYLSQLIDEKNYTSTDSKSELQAFADAVVALLATVDGSDATTPNADDISQAQLNLIGVSLVSGANAATRYTDVITYLKKSSTDFSTYAHGGAFDHILKVKEVLTAAISGLSEIERAAELNNANDAYPLLQQYGDASITGVSTDNLASINSMLNSNAVTGADITLASPGIQGLITLYNEVLTAATSGGAASLTQSEYESIGVTGFSATATRATAEVAVLNEVITSFTDNTKVDRINEVVEIRKAVTALMDTVEGKTPAVTKAQLGLLGFDIDNADSDVNSPSVTNDNLSAIQKVLADTGIGTDYDTVDSLSEIQTLVNGAVNALEAVKTEADANDGDSVTVAQLQAMGIEGAVDTGNVGENIGLINSILDGTVASTDANTLEKVQKLVDVAAKVVDLAGDASAAKLTQAELTLIGITGVNSATKLALVNDLLEADGTAQAALSDIQAFADVAAKVITNLELAVMRRLPIAMP
jgi:hypothetical protein